MHDTQSQISIPVYCGDSGRKLFITLSEGGKPYEIGEGCYAYINARTPANTTQSLMCNIANNTIEFDFSENNDAVNMIAVVGLTHCDITLFDADGHIVTAPRFTFVVVDQISNPRDVELTSDNVSLLSDWTSKFASWDTAEDGRKSQEATRQGNELTRESQETTRQSNELTRESQEATRQSNELTRESQETTRKTAEDDRSRNELDREEAEASRKEAETDRVTAEDERIFNEAERGEAEHLRQVHESDREAAEEDRKSKDAERNENVRLALSTANAAKDQSDATQVSLVNLSAQVQGIGRSYVVPNFLLFIDFLHSQRSIELKEDRDGDGVEETYNIYIGDLKTGDNIIIVEHGVPDFWFEKNSSLTSFETYLYQGGTYSLSATSGVNTIGGAHILETDYTVIEGYASSASMSAGQAGIAYDEASAAAGRASVSETNAKSASNSASTSATNASNSAASAKASENNAKASETSAKASEDNAKTYSNEAKVAAEKLKDFVGGNGGGSSEKAEYYAHWSMRVQQITADVGTKFSGHYDASIGDMEGKRGIAMLPISGFDGQLWEGQGYTEYPYAIMHPKTTGVQTFETAGSVQHILVAKGVTEITWINGNVKIVDLTLFTGDTPFPTLGGTANNKVLVQMGRKAELQAMTNWSACNIEEVETW
jgi:chemotaxis protein histidine kinase CheA